MLSRARRVRPVIVGCSTAPRTQAIRQSVMLARCRHGLEQLPEKLGSVMRTAGRRLALNHHARNRARYRVDHGTITGRSWDYFSALKTHYSPVMLALFSMKFIAPPLEKKAPQSTSRRGTPGLPPQIFETPF
jgi:hypothetical protein